jgi:hypothetical protein
MMGGGAVQINRDSPLFQAVAKADRSSPLAGRGLSLFICGELGI